MNNIEKQPVSFSIDHVNIEALGYGDSTKPIIVALHGWLDNAASFELLAPMLQSYYVLAVDFPGHGCSGWLKHEHYQVDTYLQIIKKLIDELPRKPIAFMGHSMGASVAILLTTRYPDLVNHLILLDAIGPLSAESKQSHQMTRSMAELALMARQKIYPNQEAMIHSRMRVNQLEQNEVREMVERGSYALEGGFMWRFDPAVAADSSFYYQEQDILNMLAKIQCPVLVIEASHGLFTSRPHYQKRLAAIAHLSHYRVDGEHHIHLQQPAVIAEYINTFIQTGSTNKDN